MSDLSPLRSFDCLPYRHLYSGFQALENILDSSGGESVYSLRIPESQGFGTLRQIQIYYRLGNRIGKSSESLANVPDIVSLSPRPKERVAKLREVEISSIQN
jgi:hypothetical protein